jgi:hypothetical protein
MLSTIAEVLQIHTEEDLNAALLQWERDLNETLDPLKRQLAKNVLSSDVQSLEQHMGYVESWRVRVVNYLMLAEALVEHAKSDHPGFLLPAEKGITEIKREAHQRKLAGGFKAIAGMLERLIDSIDSRVNLAKKVLSAEAEGMKSTTSPQRYAA